MSIVYAAGTKRNDLSTSITTRQGLLTAIDTTLQAAGWTSTSVHPFVVILYTGQPANNDTVTFGSAYTFKTVINNANAREVLIGATSDASYANLKNAIIGGPGSGTAYSSATVTNTAWEATLLVPGYLRVQDLIAGFARMGVLSASESLSNATLVRTATSYGGFFWTSAVNEQGLKWKLFGFDASETSNQGDIIRFIASDTGELNRSHIEPPTAVPNSVANGYRLCLGLGSSWRVIANKFQTFIMLESVAGGTGNGVWIAGGMPYLVVAQTPTAITAATNATPILITATAHGLITNDNVCIRNVAGNTNANGNWVVTVVNTNTFTLNSSVGNAAYTSGGVVGKVNGSGGGTLAEYIWFQGDTAAFLRQQLHADNTTHWVGINGSGLGGGTAAPSGSGSLSLVGAVKCHTSDGADSLVWYNNSDPYTSETLVGSGTVAAGQFFECGQMYDSVIVNQSCAKDVPGTFNSHNWKNITDANSGSSSSMEGSFLVVVP